MKTRPLNTDVLTKPFTRCKACEGLGGLTASAQPDRNGHYRCAICGGSGYEGDVVGALQELEQRREFDRVVQHLVFYNDGTALVALSQGLLAAPWFAQQLEPAK